MNTEPTSPELSMHSDNPHTIVSLGPETLIAVIPEGTDIDWYDVVADELESSGLSNDDVGVDDCEYVCGVTLADHCEDGDKLVWTAISDELRDEAGRNWAVAVRPER